MSREIYQGSGGHGLSLTEYWGGEDRGICIQLTGENCDRKLGYVGLTVEEAQAIVGELSEWIQDNFPITEVQP